MITAHHFVAATHKDGDGVGVGAALDDQHLVLGGSEADLKGAAGIKQRLINAKGRHQAIVGQRGRQASSNG
eukprot:1159958-Pelagomonas_calceolata.AAC.16